MFLTVCVFFVLLISVTAAPVDHGGLSTREVQLLDEQDYESGEYFEGDILLTAAQKKSILYSGSIRNGLISTGSRWPNRTVLYEIAEEDFDEANIKMIYEAMGDIGNKSCITFQKRNNEEEHYVMIQGTGKGCYSNVGYISDYHDKEEDVTEEKDMRLQTLNLSKNCFKFGTVVHEMLHTLGFYHMQSTYDRDEFVKIEWENIKPGKEHNFRKYTVDTVTDFGVPYDYGSVMHYPSRAFSKNTNNTISPLQANVTIGQRRGLSERDVIKLNKMYCE